METPEAYRLPRVPFTRLLRVKALSGPQPQRRMWAGNVSRGGMFIRSADPLPLGTRVRLSMDTADQFLVLGEGEVVWVRPMSEAGPAGFGVRFLKLENNATSFLDVVVRHGGVSSAMTLRPDEAPELGPEGDDEPGSPSRRH